MLGKAESRLVALVVLALGSLISAATAAPDDPPGGSDPPSGDHAKGQVERVMNAGLPFAERMLAERGEFAPYGAVMLPKGLIQALNPDSSEGATSEEIFETLVNGLREGAKKGDYRAIGVFALVELRKPDGDGTFSAVHVGLEHDEGYCVDVYYPVLLRGEGLVLDDPVAGKRTGTFFDSCQ